jgi:hypothetical protein
MARRLNIFANSFTKAILMSLSAFSMALEASATLILDTGKVPAEIIDLYKLSIFRAVSGVEPDVIFTIFSRVFTLSPGFIRSGEYPAKKSLLKRRAMFFQLRAHKFLWLPRDKR